MIIQIERCCFGYSVRTNTFIILGICVFWELWSIICGIYRVSDPKTKSSSLSLVKTMLVWHSISFMIVIYTFFGAYKRRFWYLLPYVCMNIFSLFVTGFLLILFCIEFHNESSHTYSEQIINFWRVQIQTYRNLHSDIEVTEVNKEAIFLCSLVLLIYFAINYHFLCVIHSYYVCLQRGEGAKKYITSADLLKQNLETLEIESASNMEKMYYREQPWNHANNTISVMKLNENFYSSTSAVE